MENDCLSPLQPWASSAAGRHVREAPGGGQSSADHSDIAGITARLFFSDKNG
jgi:hypothetical protein